MTVIGNITPTSEEVVLNIAGVGKIIEREIVSFSFEERVTLYEVIVNCPDTLVIELFEVKGLAKQFSLDWQISLLERELAMKVHQLNGNRIYKSKCGACGEVCYVEAGMLNICQKCS